MRKSIGTTIFLFMIFFAFSVAVGFGQGIKERMKNRLPVIGDMKARGIVGEDHRGYLRFMHGAKEREDMIVAENSDRGKVYAAIAKRQGTTAELVGRRRAIQLAEIARPGDWLQNAAGKWYRKN